MVSIRWMLLWLALGFGAMACGPAVPAPIVEMQRRAGTAEVTIVEFFDFECPYCRQLHQHLTQAIAPYQGSVQVVHKYIALRSHPHSLILSAMAICAENQGKGGEMTDALMRSDSYRVVRTKGKPLARRLGLDYPSFRSCLTAGQTAERISADMQLYLELGGSGVPWVWIGKRNFVGVQPPGVLQQAIEQARAANR